MRKAHVPVLVIFLLICLAGVAEAADQKTNSGTLFLVHREGILRNKTYRARSDRLDLEPKMGIELRNTEKVIIVVEDPNPLLFTYTWKGVTKTDTQDYQNATKFATALNSLTSVLGKVQPTPDQTSAQDAQRFMQLSLGEELFNKDRSRLSTAERLQVEEVELKAKIREVLNDLAENNFFKNLADSVDSVNQRVKSIPRLIETSAKDKVTVAGLKAEVAAWQIDSLSEGLESAFKKMDDAQLRILKLTSKDDLKDIESFDPRLLAILMAKDQQFRIENMLNTLQSFTRDVAKIDEPLVLGDLSYSPTQTQSADFDIKSVPANAKIADATKRKIGSFTLSADPLSPVMLGFGGAVVYSFVKKSEFKAETVDGKLRIVEHKGSDYSGQNVAAVLTVTPRAWDDPIFGTQFQVGFNPKKDELAFFLGAGFRVFNLARLGAGVTYQQVPKLAGDLVPNQAINSAAELKLDQRFKSGGYLFISVTTK